MSVLIPQMGKGLGGLAERGMNAYYTGRQEAKEKETRAALGSLYGKDMGVLMSNAPETVDRIGAMQARDADQARAQAKADRESLEWDQGQADRNIKLLRERAEPMKQFIKVARDLPPEQRLDVLVETMRPHIEADPQFAAAISAKLEDGVLDDADLDAFEKVSAIAAAQAQEGAPETRKMSLPGGMVQDQELVGGEWRDVGEPYDRRDPLKPYTNYNPDTGELDMGFVDTRSGERVTTGSKPDTAGKKDRKNYDRLVDAFDSYRKHLEERGPQMVPGTDRILLSSAHTDLLMELKNLYELGALQGPDYDLLTRVVLDPTSVNANVNGKDALLAQLDSVVKPKIDAMGAMFGKEDEKKQGAWLGKTGRTYTKEQIEAGAKKRGMTFEQAVDFLELTKDG